MDMLDFGAFICRMRHSSVVVLAFENGDEVEEDTVCLRPPALLISASAAAVTVIS